MGDQGRSSSSGGMPFGELMAIFQPGIRHVIEERERRRTELVVPGDSDKDWDIDLDIGVATLGGPVADDDDPPDDDGLP